MATPRSETASYDYDLFVIGAGSGGVRASRVSASLGARVAVAEERDLGGTCVNVGCIPKKLLVYASQFSEDFEKARRGYGWTVPPSSFDWSTLIANKDREIARLNGFHERLLENAGVDLVEGRARIEDPHTVVVGERRYTARYILVATGSWPFVPEVPGSEHVISSNEAFHLEKLPERVLVVGGGYIAVEFAGIFHGMGSHVTQIYRGPLFMRGFDDDMRTGLAEEMRRKGIDLRFERTLERVEKRGDELLAQLDDGETLIVDQILSATGRLPLVGDMGLEAVGVEMDEKGAIQVDAYSRSSVESIYAIGDVTDRMNLTPVALHEAMCVAETLFGKGPVAPVHKDVPSAAFSQPPIGTVGLTEAEARETYAQVDVYVSKFRALKDTLTGGESKTTMKLLVDRATDRVVGVHVLGPDAGEIVQGFAVAIKCGATKADFDSTVGIHPTSAEELVTLREPVAR